MTAGNVPPAVYPPVDEENSVDATAPLACLRTWPAVAFTALLVGSVSALRPPYTWHFVVSHWLAWGESRSKARAYERAATACAFSASAWNDDGLSLGTTPRTYVSVSTMLSSLEPLDSFSSKRPP